MLGSSNVKASNVSFGDVRLVDAPGGDRGVSLCIYKSSGRSHWFNDIWLEDGRPSELSSFKLSTWSLLTTSIKEYQTSVRVQAGKYASRVILPLYFLWFTCLFFLDFFESKVILWGLAGIICASRLVSTFLQQKHVNEVFHPAVRSVLEELAPKLQESGYTVILLEEPGSCCGI